MKCEEIKKMVSRNNNISNEYSMLLGLLNGLFEKQETLVALESQTVIEGYGYADTNCLTLIGTLENPNVTKLAAQMSMSKGAISKMMKRLISRGVAESYQKEGNLKEVYFKLTDTGRTLFEVHRVRHQIWKNRDYEFLCSLDKTMVKIVVEFAQLYNEFLEHKIELMNNNP